MTGTKESETDRLQEQSEWYVVCMVVGECGMGHWVECSDEGSSPEPFMSRAMGDLWPRSI
jgi:hypothetical protein